MKVNTGHCRRTLGGREGDKANSVVVWLTFNERSASDSCTRDATENGNPRSDLQKRLELEPLLEEGIQKEAIHVLVLKLRCRWSMRQNV